MNITLNSVSDKLGSYEDLFNTVKQRKLKRYGNVTRSSGDPAKHSTEREKAGKVEEEMRDRATPSEQQTGVEGIQ